VVEATVVKGCWTCVAQGFVRRQDQQVDVILVVLAVKDLGIGTSDKQRPVKLSHINPLTYPVVHVSRSMAAACSIEHQQCHQGYPCCCSRHDADVKFG